MFSFHYRMETSWWTSQTEEHIVQIERLGFLRGNTRAFDPLEVIAMGRRVS